MYIKIMRLGGIVGLYLIVLVNLCQRIGDLRVYYDVEEDPE